jgi:aryl-alcohol dehydrogenase-like predicted oxidoreductase
MQYTTPGRTELRVSVAGLGGGGFSRLGLTAGKTEAEAARLVFEAIDLGVNFIDTAAAYGTEGVVGKALASLQRNQVVISTKSTVRRGGERLAPPELIASLDNSLRVMGTEHIDVFNLHGVQLDDEYALNGLVPVLDAEKRKGKYGTSASPRLLLSTTPMRCSNARCTTRPGRYSWSPST